MDLYVACHRISRNPEGQKEFTGRYDVNGDAIMRSLPERFLPGAVFKPTDSRERDDFLALEAIRPLTPDEITLFESGVQREFPTSLPEPQVFGRQQTS